MRALIVLIIVALAGAPVRASGDSSTAPSDGVAQVNAPVAIAPLGPLAPPVTAAPALESPPAAPAAQEPAPASLLEDRPLGPRPAGAAGALADHPAAASRSGWGVGPTEIFR